MNELLPVYPPESSGRAMSTLSYALYYQELNAHRYLSDWKFETLGQRMKREEVAHAQAE